MCCWHELNWKALRDKTTLDMEKKIKVFDFKLSPYTEYSKFSLG